MKNKQFLLKINKSLLTFRSFMKIGGSIHQTQPCLAFHLLLAVEIQVH